MAAFFSDAAAQDAFVRKHDLAKLLEGSSDGFVRLESFLPEPAAEAVLEAVQAMGNWEKADGADDAQYADAISHRFRLAEIDGCMDEDEDAAADPAVRSPGSTLSRYHKNILRGCGKLLWRLYRPEETTPNFSAGSYRRGDHIAPHDDLVEESYGRDEAAHMRKYLQKGFACAASSRSKEGGAAGEASESSTDSETGEAEDPPVPFVREVACVFYLNKDWDASKRGGHFVDLKTGTKHPPDFNSLVVFRVPRMHAVEEVRGEDRDGVSRLSLFGWWLREEEEKKKKARRRKKKVPKTQKPPSEQATPPEPKQEDALPEHANGAAAPQKRKKKKRVPAEAGKVKAAKRRKL